MTDPGTLTQSLRRCVLSRNLTKQEYAFIERSAKFVSVAVNGILYSESQSDNSNLYFVASGRFRATIKMAHGVRTMREYGPGDCMGSADLFVAPIVRSHTLTAVDAASVYVINAKTFDTKLRHAPQPAPRLRDALRAAPLFSTLSPEEITLLARAVDEISTPSYEVVCREGEMCREIYAIQGHGQLQLQPATVADSNVEGSEDAKGTILCAASPLNERSCRWNVEVAARPEASPCTLTVAHVRVSPRKAAIRKYMVSVRCSPITSSACIRARWSL